MGYDWKKTVIKILVMFLIASIPEAIRDLAEFQGGWYLTPMLVALLVGLKNWAKNYLRKK